MRLANPGVGMRGPPCAAMAIIICASVALTGTPAGADISLQDFAKILDSAQKGSRVPGLAAVMLDGQTMTAAAAGLRAAAPSPKVAVRPNDIFDLASCFKAITATIVARLVEKGKVKWTTTIVQVFPELGNRMRPQYRNVTITQLLAHRGRVPDFIAGLDDNIQRFNGTRRAARVHFLPQLLTAAPAGSPGSFHYSNNGYVVVGAMIERLLNENFESIMRRELIAPLNIPSVRFGIAGSNNPQVIDQPRPHNGQGRPILPKDINSVRVIDDMAGVYSLAMKHWARVAQVHLSVTPQSGPYLTKASLTKLHTPVGSTGPRYALGWDVAVRSGQTVVSHEGSNAVMYTEVALNLATRRGIVFAANQENPGYRAARSVFANAQIVAWLRGM